MSMTTASTLTTIQELRKLFSQSDTLVSDNGPQFSSREFLLFCKHNGIHHIRVSPYHPSSNGLAERAVRIFKIGLKKQTRGTLTVRIARFLFQYRNTPHTTTGSMPAELLMGRRLRSRLDLIKPDIKQRVQEKQGRQQLDHAKHAKAHSFKERESVFVKNHRNGDKWLPGEIVKATCRTSVLYCPVVKLKRHF